MNKINELIEECDIEFDKYTNKTTFHKNEIIGLMKDYAEFYCEQFRNNLLEYGYYDDYGYLQVDTNTIRTLPLHPHD